MFERFTDRARRIVVLAQEEARGLQHNYIGTEHLLLGALVEGEGVAATVLVDLGVPYESVHARLVEIIGLGQTAPSGHIPFTPRAKKVIQLSLLIALRMGHGYVGTEHVLLGLVAEGEGVACQIMIGLGADLDRVHEHVITTLASYPDAAVPEGAPPWAIRDPYGFRRYNETARRAIVAADEEAQNLRHNHIGTEHHLLGMLRENTVAARALTSLGITYDAVRHDVELIARPDAQPPAGRLPAGLSQDARRMLALAPREADQLGHRDISTQHLLLALVRPNEGVACQVLVALGANLDLVRRRALNPPGAPPGTAPSSAPGTASSGAPGTASSGGLGTASSGGLGTASSGGPGTASSGAPGTASSGAPGTAPGGPPSAGGRQAAAGYPPRVTFERFTDRARRVIVLSQEEARTLGHNYIGTEHLLLGLIQEGGGVAAKVIELAGISLTDLRADTEEIIGRGPGAPTGHIPFTPRSKKVLECAMREALALGHDYVGTEHLLLGMIREGEGVAAEVLIQRGLGLDGTRRSVIQLLAPATESAVEEWARWQAATVARDGGRPVELYHGASGLVLLARSGLHLPLGFVTDVLRLTRAGSQPDERLAALHALPNVQRMRALAWPTPARVGFAALLGADAPADSRLVAPGASAAELRDSLMRAVARARVGEPQDEVTAEILNSGRRLSDGVVTTLLAVGPGAVAADPLLPLRLRDGADCVPALSGPQRALLEWTGARAVVPARSRSSSTAPGPGLTGISRRGKLTNLLPSQLALPSELLRHRFANGALLYRLHETETQPPVESVRILLDASPSTFGSIGVVLRIVVQAIVSALWAARRVPTLVYLDQPELETPVHKPSDLGLVWTRQSLEPVDLAPVLVSAQRSEQPSVLLTQHWLVADHGIVATERLRVITTQRPGDDPEVPPSPPFHAHLAAEPTKAQLAAAVSAALAPQER